MSILYHHLASIAIEIKNIPKLIIDWLKPAELCREINT
jgi:hypothetical protein